MQNHHWFGTFNIRCECSTADMIEILMFLYVIAVFGCSTFVREEFNCNLGGDLC